MGSLERSLRSLRINFLRRVTLGFDVTAEKFLSGSAREPAIYS